MNIVLNLLLFPVAVTTIQIPFIDNAIFIAMSNSSSTTIINQTCNQCLCQSNSSYIALNCFPNDTCQFFTTYPRTYRIQSISQARLYFLQQILPNESQCCMPNTSYLLNQLNTITPIFANVLAPRCIVLDNYGYIVTVSQVNYTIVRLYSTNLTVVNQPVSPIFTSVPMTIAYYDETYYVGFQFFILAIDSSNLGILSNITTPYLQGTRGMIFLDNGQTMVVASTNVNLILFFNRSDTVSKNYSYFYQQSVNYPDPHGFWYVNDTYFYLTSWENNLIYSYSAINNNLTWNENLFINASSVTSQADGDHLVVDECDRFWFLLGANGIRISDNPGVLLGNFTMINSIIFDAIISDDYVIYLSDTELNRVSRIDLNIQCS